MTTHWCVTFCNPPAVSGFLSVVLQGNPYFLIICLTCFVSGGCTNAIETNTVSVSGIVTYRGQPVAGAEVGLLPREESSDVRAARGVTEDDGSFTVNTYFNSSQDVKGARAGEYTVTVSKYEAPNKMSLEEWHRANYERPGSVPPLRHLVPEKYGHVQSSDLTVTVENGEDNHFELELVD